MLQGSPLVSEEARAAVPAAIEQLGYRPNAAAYAGAPPVTLHRRAGQRPSQPVLPHGPGRIDEAAEEHGYTSLIVRGSAAAFGVLDALAEHGLEIPRDMSAA